ncbi:MAG: radical SAM protein, partial [Candidatus Omnitrophica bacterium]|nr:radical SAM protein [Candidatus Omnitrophota bacterium]
PIKVCFIGVGSPTHYNVWNNLSLETLAGDLKGEFGKQVDVSMLWTNEPQELDTIWDQAMSGSPDIIGISVQPGSMALVELLAKKLNAEPAILERKIMAVFGNQIPTYIPEKFIELCPQGIVIRGEGELAMRSLVRVAQGESKLSDVPSAIYRDKETGEMISTPVTAPNLVYLKHLPASNSYAAIAGRGGNVQVQASRGCPWGGCSYCTRTSFRRGGLVVESGSTASWEGFTVERVLATLDAAMSRGVTEVEFSDDDFLGGREDEKIERIVKIAEGIEKLREKYRIKFSFRIFTRPSIIYRKNDPDHQNGPVRQMLLRLQKAGLVRVFIGAETGNRSQLQRYNRGLELSEVTDAIRLLREMGIGVDIGFIMFDPELTIDEMLENIRYFRENDLIEGNQWPFRPMLINHGSKMVQRLGDVKLLGAEDVNSMSYGFRFRDNAVAEIARRVDAISKKTAAIFYALKVKSKIFDPAKKDGNVRRCQRHLEENGLLYLDLMEALGWAMQKSASKEELEAIAKRTDERVLELVARVSGDVASSRIRDDDGYLRRVLSRIGFESRTPDQRSELRTDGHLVEDAVAQKNIPFSLYVNQKTLRSRSELRTEIFALSERLKGGRGKLFVLTDGEPADLELTKLFKGRPVFFQASSQALRPMGQKERACRVMLFTHGVQAETAGILPQGIVPFLLLEDRDVWAALLLAVSDKTIPGIGQRNGFFQVVDFVLRDQLHAFRSSLVVRIAA